MKKRMFFTLLGCLIVFGGVFGFKAYVDYQTEQAMSQRSAPVQTVSATEAVADTWRPELTAVGSTSAVRGVDITSETTGRITAVEVEDGASVEAGDVLVELDSEGLQADLRGARAEARLVEIELERQRRLRVQNANSESDVDRAESELEQARARVDGVQAALDKKTIRAPFTGRLGILDIEEGQYIDVGVMIATLQTLDPIEVDFTVPQRELARIEAGQNVTATADAFPGRGVHRTDPGDQSEGREFHAQCRGARSRRQSRWSAPPGDVREYGGALRGRNGCHHAAADRDYL